MSSQTPIWFLDVDGVINAVSLACPDGFERCKAAPDKHGSFTIQYDPRVIAEINRMHDDGLVQVMWLTTWGSAANGDLREKIGINQLEVAGEPPLYATGGYGSGWGSAPGGWWKFSVVMEFYEENPDRKYVWTDDDLKTERDAFDWATEKENVFPVAPLQHKSLSMYDLHEIEAFLKGEEA